MRTGISVSVSAADRRRLQAIVADPKSPQKHVWRARIVLLTADGVGTNRIMATTGKSKTCVWRWQERFMEAGVAGLLNDKTRPPGKAPIAEDRVAAVVRLTLTPPPHEATHWTVRAMAKASGMAVSTVQDIWKEHGLAPSASTVPSASPFSKSPSILPCRRRTRSPSGSRTEASGTVPAAKAPSAGVLAQQALRRECRSGVVALVRQYRWCQALVVRHGPTAHSTEATARPPLSELTSTGGWL